MLILRREQLEEFRHSAWNVFETEIVRHSQKFAPTLCRAAGPVHVGRAVRQGLARASQYGFTMRGPLRFYIELMLTFGSGLDSDPQLPWLAVELAGEGKDERSRAYSLYAAMNQYFNFNSATQSDKAAMSALVQASELTPDNLNLVSGSLECKIQLLVSEGFPEKWKCAGRERPDRR